MAGSCSDQVPGGVPGGVAHLSAAVADRERLAPCEADLDGGGRAVVGAHPQLVGGAVAESVLGLVGAVAVGDQPLRLRHHHAVGEPARRDRVRQLLAQAGQPALVVEVGMGDHDQRDLLRGDAERRAARA